MNASARAQYALFGAIFALAIHAGVVRFTDAVLASSGAHVGITELPSPAGDSVVRIESVAASALGNDDAWETVIVRRRGYHDAEVLKVQGVAGPFQLDWRSNTDLEIRNVSGLVMFQAVTCFGDIRVRVLLRGAEEKRDDPHRSAA